MSTKTKIIYFVFLFLALFSNAQGSYEFGLLPTINVNKKLEKGWQINFKTEFRQILKQGLYYDSNDFNYDYEFTDLTVLASKKTSLRTALGGGYLFRIKGDLIIHRTIQQFTITSRLSGLRLTHRIASDQTFDKEDDTEIRLRYRLASEIALSGQSVDPNELYIKMENEYLNSFQDSDYDLEVRFIPMLGYKITDSNKLEFGLDYRIRQFINGYPASRYWINLNWFISI